MNKLALTGFRFLLFSVLIGKISDWFLNYSQETNQILNTLLFSLIGIAFIFIAFSDFKFFAKVSIIACGIYLILMNFVSDFYLKSTFGIICILIPFLISRFSSKVGAIKN